MIYLELCSWEINARDRTEALISLSSSILYDHTTIPILWKYQFQPCCHIKSKSVILFYQKKWVKWVKKINRVFFFSILWGQKGNLFLPYFPRIIFWFRFKMVTNFPFRYKMVTNYRLDKFNTVESDKHILDQNRENTMIRKLEDWKDVKWSSWVA